MGEIGSLLTGWDGRTGQTRWDGGGMEVPVLEGARLGVLTLDIDVRRAEQSGGCHQFHRCCRGRGVFVSVHQNNHNTLHKNPNYNIVQNSTKSTYDTILI